MQLHVYNKCDKWNLSYKIYDSGIEVTHNTAELWKEERMRKSCRANESKTVKKKTRQTTSHMKRATGKNRNVNSNGIDEWMEA